MDNERQAMDNRQATTDNERQAMDNKRQTTDTTCKAMTDKGTTPFSGHGKAVYVEGVGWRREAHHSFTRRDSCNDYRDGGKAYMLTLTVEEDAPLFGEVSGSLDGFDIMSPLHCCCPDGEPSSLAGPHVRLTALGCAVLQILLNLRQRYGDVITFKDDEFVVMPEHIHLIVYMRQATEKHLSDFVKSLKGSCNAAYRFLLTQGKTTAVGMARQWHAAYLAAPPARRIEMTQWLEKACQRALAFRPADDAKAADGGCSSTWLKNTGEGSAPDDIGTPPLRISTPGERGTTGFLFRPNYNDKHISAYSVFEEKRRYIRNNPRTRLMRMCHRDRQQVARRQIDTAITLPALHAYLRRECGALASPDRLAMLDSSLLLKYSSTKSKNTIHLDCYGEAGILAAENLLPVVCHRRDESLYNRQHALLLHAARNVGAVLVSARVAKGEQRIMDDASTAALPTVRVMPEGFPERYHPSDDINRRCAEGQMLLVSPWRWVYRRSGEKMDSVIFKTLNCIAQSLCHKKDTFWKEWL